MSDSVSIAQGGVAALETSRGRVADSLRVGLAWPASAHGLPLALAADPVSVAPLRRMVPVSSLDGHPANEAHRTVYLARTGCWFVGGRLLPLEARTRLLGEAMRATGAGNTLDIEVEGSFGSYAGEVMPAVRAAARAMPAGQRPAISALFSGGLPAPESAFGRLARSLDPAPGHQLRAGQRRGTLGTVHTDGLIRVVPNWGNDRVFEGYARGVDAWIDRAETAGMPVDITIDDHVGVPGGLAGLEGLARANGLPDADAGREILTARIGQLADRVHARGGQFTLSLVGSFAEARAAGIDAERLAPRLDRLEFQVYRPGAAGVRDTLAAIYARLAADPRAFARVREFRVALTGQVGGHELPEQCLVTQQHEIDRFSARVRDLARRSGVPDNAWRVSVSLWYFGQFYRPAGPAAPAAQTSPATPDADLPLRPPTL